METLSNKPVIAILACAMLWAPHIAAAQTITVGATSSTSDAPIYIAEKKGFFQAEGLEVKVTNFRSAADMVAPLGAGQIQAGAGSASAGLYNAVARGIRIKIVADKASSPPGYGATKILVRKDQDSRAQGSCGERPLQGAQGPQGHEVCDECAGGQQYIDAEHAPAFRRFEIFRRGDG
jgi:ABC-type nitrate/sulfonate/bicarbonate transport system substrate-binding protein